MYKARYLTVFFSVLAAVAIAFLVWRSGILVPPPGEAPLVPISYKNAVYTVDGHTVVLKDGVYEMPAAPNSASKIVTRYFGNEVVGDFNSDGLQDVAFVLTQDGSGSGTFYYAVAALGNDGGYRGTNAIYLGDRIAPQTTEYREGKIIVNYADRLPSEPMSARPSVGVSRYLQVVGGLLVDVTPTTTPGVD